MSYSDETDYTDGGDARNLRNQTVGWLSLNLRVSPRSECRQCIALRVVQASCNHTN